MHLSGFQNEIWFSCPVPLPSVEVQTNILLSYLVIVLYYLCHQPFLSSRLYYFLSSSSYLIFAEYFLISSEESVKFH